MTAMSGNGDLAPITAENFPQSVKRVDTTELSTINTGPVAQQNMMFMPAVGNALINLQTQTASSYAKASNGNEDLLASSVKQNMGQMQEVYPSRNEALSSKAPGTGRGAVPSTDKTMHI